VDWYIFEKYKKEFLKTTLKEVFFCGQPAKFIKPIY
jgi:hypothetical protein